MSAIKIDQLTVGTTAFIVDVGNVVVPAKVLAVKARTGAKTQICIDTGSRLALSVSSSSTGSTKSIMPPTTLGASERLLRSYESAEDGPVSGFFGEGSRIGGAGGWQVDQSDAGWGCDELPSRDGSSRAVEGDRPQRWKIVEQMLDPVVFGFANRLVEAAATACRGDDVPQADTPRGEELEPLLVRKRLQLIADHASEKAPELVGRVGIITPRGKRCFSRQAAQAEQLRIAPCDRRQSPSDAHE